MTSVAVLIATAICDRSNTGCHTETIYEETDE
jgi:hypothetical protein